MVDIFVFSSFINCYTKTGPGDICTISIFPLSQNLAKRGPRNRFLCKYTDELGYGKMEKDI